MIYDTAVADPGAYGGDSGQLAEVTVGTATADVTCGRIPNATVIQLNSGNSSRLQVHAEYNQYRFAFMAALPLFIGEAPIQGVGGGSRVWSTGCGLLRFNIADSIVGLDDSIFEAGLQYASAWDADSSSLQDQSTTTTESSRLWYQPKVCEQFLVGTRGLTLSLDHWIRDAMCCF